MISAVLDANVILSGILGLERLESAPGAVWRAWRDGRFELIVSKAIIVEVERALRSPFFSNRLEPALIDATMAALIIDGTSTALSTTVVGIASHAEDDLILATSASAEADFLVTGDRHLLRLESFQGTKILPPREFLNELR